MVSDNTHKILSDMHITIHPTLLSLHTDML